MLLREKEGKRAWRAQRKRWKERKHKEDECSSTQALRQLCESVWLAVNRLLWTGILIRPTSTSAKCCHISTDFLLLFLHHVCSCFFIIWMFLINSSGFQHLFFLSLCRPCWMNHQHPGCSYMLWFLLVGVHMICSCPICEGHVVADPMRKRTFSSVSMCLNSVDTEVMFDRCSMWWWSMIHRVEKRW